MFKERSDSHADHTIEDPRLGTLRRNPVDPALGPIKRQISPQTVRARSTDSPELRNIEVKWSEEDRLFVARVLEGTGITGHGDTAHAACKMAEENYAEYLKMLDEEVLVPAVGILPPLDVRAEDWEKAREYLADPLLFAAKAALFSREREMLTLLGTIAISGAAPDPPPMSNLQCMGCKRPYSSHFGPELSCPWPWAPVGSGVFESGESSVQGVVAPSASVYGIMDRE